MSFRFEMRANLPGVDAGSIPVFTEHPKRNVCPSHQEPRVNPLDELGTNPHCRRE